MKQKLTLLILALLTTVGAWATVSFDSNKYYYIIEATTMRYAGSGVAGSEAYWGLQPAGKMGNKFLFNEVSSGVFTIQDTNGANFGASGWNATNTSTSWTIEETGDGSYYLSRLDGSTTKYLNYQTAYTASLYTDRTSKTDDEGHKIKFNIVEGLLPVNKHIRVSSTKANTFTASSGGTNYWYVMTQAKGGESPMYDDFANQAVKRASTSTVVSGSAIDNDKYLVRFVATGTGDSYYVQFATGDFVYSPNPTTQSDPLKSHNTNATKFMVYKINNENTHIGWNVTTDGEAYGKRIDNNGAGSTVVLYDDNQITSTGGNNDWNLYPVTLEDPVTVTYKILYGDSNTEVKSWSIKSITDVAIPSIPSSMKRDFCSYGSFYGKNDLTGDEVTTVPAGGTTVYAKATWSGPFTISSDFAGATWYLLRMKDGTKNIKYQDGSSAYPLEDVASYDIAAEDYYSWAFLGNPYDLKIVNKQAGSSKKLYQGASVGNGGIPTMSDENESSWTITRGTADSNFGISPNGYSYYLNAWNGGATVQYWQSGPGSDSGSRLTVMAVDDIDFTSMVTTYIKPYIDNPSNAYFAVTSDNVATLLTNHAEGGSKTSWTKSEYQSYYTALQTAITKPASGYYVLKNVNSGAYLIYNGTGTADGANNTAAAIIKLTPSGSGYTLQMQGAYLKVPNYTESLTTQSDPAIFYATIANSTPGQVKLGTDDGAHTYLNYSGGVVKGLQPTTNTGWWILEDAPSTISIPLTAANDNTSEAHTYATLCVPFEITDLTGIDDKEVKAYAPTKSGDYIVPGSGATTITEGTPVLLIGEEGASSVTATIGSDYATSPATTNALTGTFTAATIDTRAETGTNFVLGFDEDNDDRIGFYNVDNESFALRANRAYLKLDGSGDPTHVKGFVIDFDDDATSINCLIPTLSEGEGTIYNLAGQRVSKIQKGINIINGKKILK